MVACVNGRLLGCTASVRVSIANDRAMFVCLTRSRQRVQTDKKPRKTSGRRVAYGCTNKIVWYARVAYGCTNPIVCDVSILQTVVP